MPGQKDNYNNPFNAIFPRNSTPLSGTPIENYTKAIDHKVRTVEPIGDYIPIRWEEWNVFGNITAPNYWYYQFGELYFGAINVVRIEDLNLIANNRILFRVNGRAYPYNSLTDTNLIRMNIPIMSKTTIEITWSVSQSMPQLSVSFCIEGFYYNK